MVHSLSIFDAVVVWNPEVLSEAMPLSSNGNCALIDLSASNTRVFIGLFSKVNSSPSLYSSIPDSNDNTIFNGVFQQNFDQECENKNSTFSLNHRCLQKMSLDTGLYYTDAHTRL
jgi:hypothetical protein